MAKLITHFSDGKKIVCGADKDSTAVIDPQKVNCPKCQTVIDAKAQADGDPIVRCTIYNQDLKEGQDFNFCFEKTGYHGVSGAIHRIPKSVAEHLAGLAVPQKAYREGQEAGQSMIDVGERRRFIVNILEVMGKPDKKNLEKPIEDPPKFKVGDKVTAEYEDDGSYDGEIVKKVGNKFRVKFPDGDIEMFELEELTLI